VSTTPGDARPLYFYFALQPRPRHSEHARLPPQGHAVAGVSTWFATALFALVLVVLLVFILQNGHSVALKFFSISGHLPLGVALLLAAAAGILLVALPGTARIVQLRRTARRHQHAAETAQTAAGIRVPGQQ